MPPEVATYCVRCGRAFQTVEVRLYRNRFPADRFCAVCRETDRAEADQRRADALFSRARIPSSYSACAFSNFERRDGVGDALHAARQLSTDVRGGRVPHRGLIFLGPPGTGKTHLAVAIVREVIYSDRFTPALFVNVPEWLNSLRSVIDDRDVHAPASPQGYELLVLDDLGLENPTPWARDQLYSLINHRDANGLLTVVTSNASTGELRSQLGGPTASRLQKMCKTLELRASDYREQELGIHTLPKAAESRAG